MNRKNFITYTGIWSYLPVLLLSWMIVEQVAADWSISDSVKYMLMFGLPLIAPLTIFMTNRDREKRGQTDFSLKATFALTEKDEKHSAAYRKAAYPNAPKQYSFPLPEGFVIGRQGKNYIGPPVGKDGVGAVICGSPGSGKSAMLLAWLYANRFRDQIETDKQKLTSKNYNYFLVDIKPELFPKLLGIKAEDYTAEEYTTTKVIQPSNRSSYGYDVLYRVHKEGVDETEIIQAVSDICDALIVPSGDNPFFDQNAKKILSGLLYYYIKEGWDFVPTIQKILRTDFNILIDSVVQDAREKGYGLVLDKLQGFAGKADSESLGDIESTAKTYLDWVSFPDLSYCLMDNPNRISPAELNDGKTNVVLGIEESMLSAYSSFFRLICLQVVSHCTSEFREEDDRHTAVILDEAARLKKISCLLDLLATARGRHVSCMMLFQNLNQFNVIYGTEESKAILALCEFKVFLSGGDKESADYVSNCVGQYDVTKMSYNRKGFLGGKSNGQYSTERRNIVEATDMMELREKGELIALIYGHYVRCKKIKYWEDSVLAPLIKQNQTEVKT